MNTSKPVRVLELFAGYGGASHAFKRTNIPHQVVGFSEIDKYAIKTYEHNHPNIKNYGDCTKIDPKELPDFDLLTGGFPCQAFSIAGARKGFEDTRGTLIYDVLRIAAEKKPKYMLLENVRGLLSHDNGETYKTIRHAIMKLGYGIVYKVLNSKDYGTPQNRERIWIVCKLGGWDFMEFQFPNKEPLTVFLKDLLDKEVDKKYYLSNEQQSKLFENPDLITRQESDFVSQPYSIGNVNPSGRGMNGEVYGGEIAPTLTTNKGEGTKIAIKTATQQDRMICLDGAGNEVPNTPETGQANRIYSLDGISPALNVGWVPKTQLVIKTATQQGWEFAEEGDGLSLDYPDSETRRGRVQKQISPTLQTDDTKGVVTKNFLNGKPHKPIYEQCEEIEKGHKNIGEVLSTLSKEVGTEEVQWEAGGLWSIQQKKILQSRVHEEEFFISMVRKSIATTRECESKAIEEERKLRKVWESEKSRYSPQRQKQTEQQFKKFRSLVSELSHQRASQERWLEQNQSSKQTQEHKRSVSELTIRKLTPTECFRLQGFKDGEITFPEDISDSQKYKMAGNGWELNVVTKLLNNIFAQ